MGEDCGQTERLPQRVLSHVEGVLKASEMLREDICGAAPPVEAEGTAMQAEPTSLAENLTWRLDAIGKAVGRIDGNLQDIRNALSPYQPAKLKKIPHATDIGRR